MKGMAITDGLLIGHAEIDAGHQQLVDLVQECIDRQADGDESACAASLGQVGEALKTHFDLEIKVMADLGYLEVKDHHGIHKVALKRFKKIHDRCNAGPCRGCKCLLELNKLLYDDLLKSDMDFKSYLQQIYYR